MRNAVTNRALFKQYPQTRKHVFLNLPCTYGMLENEHGLIDPTQTLDALFGSD